MIAGLFIATTIICAIGWFASKVSAAGILWYLNEKGYPFPSDEEMKKGTQWAAEHIIKDAFRGKH